jgi:hypothetical protein
VLFPSPASFGNMPRVSIRQQLLRGAYKYAEKLQKWRRRDKEQAMRHAEEEEEITAGLGVGDDLYTQNTDEPLEDESDGSSISSISAISSLSSINTDSDSGEFTLDISSDILLDEEPEMRYNTQYQAIRDHIQLLERTRVINPNKVHKLSQLYLVLESYKTDDSKWFHRNLRVMPSTFDALLTRIDSHYIFLNEGSGHQLPVEQQLAIALF